MQPFINRLFKRHVHLDFHTSEAIDGIGSKFSKENFQDALKTGKLDAITVFAKCHHGWCYYPTTVGSPHPHLTRDLLGEEIAACHEIGIKAPIYITVGWSANDAVTHPEWVVRDKDGYPRNNNFNINAKPNDPKPYFSWLFMCPNGGYLNHLKALTQEICDTYPVDGIFYDICNCWLGDCYCDACVAGRKANGINPDNDSDVKEYTRQSWIKAMDTLNAVIEVSHPEATVFYNGNAGLDTDPRFFERLTHFELEDLPTTWGGYDKFPVRAKFFMKQGKDRLAMSGKFHKAWGEFGGFKHSDAIRFEASSMVAYGASCSFGDQAHPTGLMELATYKNIGVAYSYVEQIEEYAANATGYSRLGLWLCGSTPHDQGVADMLLETQHDFDVIGPDDDLSNYEAVILTGAVCLDKSSATSIHQFVNNGGKILALYKGPMNPDETEFMLDLGVSFDGFSEFEIDYLHSEDGLHSDLPDAPFLNYEPAVKTRITGGDALAWIHEPYFRRTYATYCSHMNTPYRLERAAHPAAIQSGNMIYLAHPLGKLYYEHGARVHRQYFINALKRLHKQPVVRVDMPSAGRINILKQSDKRRYCVHLLYGPPMQRGACLVIEDLVPLANVSLILDVPETITRAYLAPQGENIALISENDAVRVTVTEVRCHQVVVFEY